MSRPCACARAHIAARRQHARHAKRRAPCNPAPPGANRPARAVQVSNADGYMCHIHVEVEFPVPPTVLFEIFTHPGAAWRGAPT